MDTVKKIISVAIGAVLDLLAGIVARAICRLLSLPAIP